MPLALHNVAKLYIAFGDNSTLVIMLQEWRKMAKNDRKCNEKV